MCFLDVKLEFYFFPVWRGGLLHAEESTRKKLKRLQDSDPTIAEVKKFVRKRIKLPNSYPSTWYKRNNNWLVIKDGILYRRSYCPNVHSNILQAVIPDGMIKELLESMHGSEWSGHPPAEKMMEKIKRFAIWPSLPTDAHQTVTNCRICDQLREQIPKHVTPLQPIIATKVFDHVMCDLISFSVPSFGYKYVLIFKDIFSGFIRCYKRRCKVTRGPCLSPRPSQAAN